MIYFTSTGKSLLEALILASTNKEYDKILFIDLPVQKMKTTSSEHVVYINYLNVKTKQKKHLCTQYGLSQCQSCQTHQQHLTMA